MHCTMQTHAWKKKMKKKTKKLNELSLLQWTNTKREYYTVSQLKEGVVFQILLRFAQKACFNDSQIRVKFVWVLLSRWDVPNTLVDSTWNQVTTKLLSGQITNGQLLLFVTKVCLSRFERCSAWSRHTNYTNFTPYKSMCKKLGLNVFILRSDNRNWMVWAQQKIS